MARERLELMRTAVGMGHANIAWYAWTWAKQVLIPTPPEYEPENTPPADLCGMDACASKGKAYCHIQQQLSLWSMSRLSAGRYARDARYRNAVRTFLSPPLGCWHSVRPAAWTWSTRAGAESRRDSSFALVLCVKR